jgi:hypothetical protein
MQENIKRIAKNTMEDALGKKAILEMCPMQAKKLPNMTDNELKNRV